MDSWDGAKAARSSPFRGKPSPLDFPNRKLRAVRIVSGKARGRKLLTPPTNDRAIRPTSDRAREALFNILGKSTEHAKVLDLFAGTGALGLEAYSRGAEQIVFIDVMHQARQLIRRNIARIFGDSGEQGRLMVIDHDLAKGLPQGRLRQLAPGGFDLIFADPPYGTHLSLSILNHIDSSQLLIPDGLLVVEERSTCTLPERLPHLQQVDQRRYGEVGLWFYRRAGEADPDETRQ